MTILKLIVLYVLISTTCSQAKNGLPREYACARLMTVMLSNNILLGGQQIPDGWSDFMVINYLKKQAMPSASEIKAINSFALVPHSPVIKKHDEISTEYSGNRLFLISRYKIYTKFLPPGRCVILIYPPVDNFEKTNSAAFFVPETTAQLILAQIPGFDPTEQPLAFDDNFIVANKKNFQGDDLDSTILAIEENTQVEARSPNPQHSDSAHKEDKDSIQKNLQKIQAAKDAKPLFRNLTTWLVIGTFLIIGIIFWFFVNRMKTRKRACEYA